tara:strand:+ start:910 stop:1338 length:429 start_codon:yes stop_codon:yes gene_type:complete
MEHVMDAERLLHTLIRHEGIKYKPYRCTAGKLTIGVGRNIEDVGISESEAMHMLKNDVAVVAAQCMGSFEWYAGLNEYRQEAIINLVFNMGLSKFKQFKKTISYIESGDFEKAGAELLDSNYARQVKGRAVEVANMLSDGGA